MFLKYYGRWVGFGSFALSCVLGCVSCKSKCAKLAVAIYKEVTKGFSI